MFIDNFTQRYYDSGEIQGLLTLIFIRFYHTCSYICKLSNSTLDKSFNLRKYFSFVLLCVVCVRTCPCVCMRV